MTNGVLLVDDEAASYLLKRVLQADDYQVRVTSSLLWALESLSVRRALEKRRLRMENIRYRQEPEK